MPLLSIVVVLFEMQREAPRTLLSLSTKYQVGISAGDYEVVVIDNGSASALPNAVLDELGPGFVYHYLPTASPSPAAAINIGVRRARGSIIGLWIDGARLATPGVVCYALKAFRAYADPVVATLGWHLGPDLQRRSALQGYGARQEDELLSSIRWPKDGYRLFEIATLGGSCQDGWFWPIAESNGLFMLKSSLDALGGADERFDLPGGGLLNLDLYARALELPRSSLVILLGEGTFHQIHGGAAANAPETEFADRWARWEKQYAAIRGHRYQIPHQTPDYLGHVPDASLVSMRDSAVRALELIWRRPQPHVGSPATPSASSPDATR